MILMHLMCIPQKGHTFCDIITFDVCVSSGGTSFISAEGFFNGSRILGNLLFGNPGIAQSSFFLFRELFLGLST